MSARAFRQSFFSLIFVVLNWPVQALELVMVERPGCPWCARWNHDVAPVYDKTPESRTAPLTRVDIDELAAHSLINDKPIALTKPVRLTPTFLLIENGQEVGRITGYMNDDMFWGLLDKLIAESQRAMSRDTSSIKLAN